MLNCLVTDFISVIREKDHMYLLTSIIKIAHHTCCLQHILSQQDYYDGHPIRYPIAQLLHLYLQGSNSTAPLKHLCCYHALPPAWVLQGNSGTKKQHFYVGTSGVTV